MRRISGQVCQANDVPATVHPQRSPKGTPETTEINHLFLFWIPQEGIHGRNTTRRIRSKAGEGLTRNLPAIVDNPGRTVGSAQCTQILHTSRFGPDECMRLGRAGKEHERLSE